MLSTVAIEKNLAESFIIKEMVSTESSYNQSLELLDSAFSQDESVQNSPILMQLKSIISSLKNISDMLLVNVNKGLNEAISPEERLKLKIERAQLMKAFFHAYQSYPALYNVYLVDCKSSPVVFETLNARILQDTNQVFGLASLLIQPIQRGIRYEMLIKELLKQSADLPKKNVNELEELQIFIADSLNMANSVMVDINPQKSAITTSEPEPYKFGDYSRYYSRSVLGFFYSQSVSQSVTAEDKIISSMEAITVICPAEQSVESGVESKFSEPPTDLPPPLPDGLAIELDLYAENSQPPTDLPPQLSADESDDSLDNENRSTFGM